MQVHTDNNGDRNHVHEEHDDDSGTEIEMIPTKTKMNIDMYTDLLWLKMTMMMTMYLLTIPFVFTRL